MLKISFAWLLGLLAVCGSEQGRAMRSTAATANGRQLPQAVETRCAFRAPVVQYLLFTTGMMVPASVWILYSAFFFPSRSARNLAMQRIPLPHISGCAYCVVNGEEGERVVSQTGPKIETKTVGTGLEGSELLAAPSSRRPRLGFGLESDACACRLSG